MARSKQKTIIAGGIGPGLRAPGFVGNVIQKNKVRPLSNSGGNGPRHHGLYGSNPKPGEPVSKEVPSD